MSGDPLGLYDYRPGDGNNALLQKILRACAALPGSMGIPEAPIDGQPYARMNAGWVVAAGGVSVIAGVVDTHADLPVTVGSPVLNSAYLVRESSGAWLPFYDTRKAGGIWIRQFNNGNLDDWAYSGELQATQNAANFTIYDSVDPTKELGFNAAGITAGARRILTPLDKNYTVEETGHHAKHENGGSDEISVAGLSGVLADPQPPIIGATGTTAVAGNDSRLTNERVPTAAGLTTKFGTNKATVVDGDKITMLDSAASDAPVHILWSLVKSTLKTYFDTLYGNKIVPVGITIDGGGSVITAGAKGSIKVLNACTITAISIAETSDTPITGSITVDVWRAASGAYPPVVGGKISASAPVTLSSANVNEATSLTGWTLTLAAGDWLTWVVTGTPTSVKRVTIVASTTKT